MFSIIIIHVQKEKSYSSATAVFGQSFLKPHWPSFPIKINLPEHPTMLEWAYKCIKKACFQYILWPFVTHFAFYNSSSHNRSK